MTRDAVLDFSREDRIGLPEAVFCQGKTPSQISAILDASVGNIEAGLLTRLSPQALESLDETHRTAINYEPLSRTGFWGRPPAPQGNGNVAILTAGTSDLGPAREAARTLAFGGETATEIADVGVAGLWRLMERLEEVRRHPVVIVAAGMEGALFSVVGGLVGSVVIALPTSQGYGVASGGRVAVDSALASCAPGIAAVNADNGYGAACIALRVLGAMRSQEQAQS